MSSTSFITNASFAPIWEYMELNKPAMCYSNCYKCSQGVTYLPQPLQSPAERKQILADADLVIEAKEEERRSDDRRFRGTLIHPRKDHTKARAELVDRFNKLKAKATTQDVELWQLVIDLESMEDEKAKRALESRKQTLIDQIQLRDEAIQQVKKDLPLVNESFYEFKRQLIAQRKAYNQKLDNDIALVEKAKDRTLLTLQEDAAWYFAQGQIVSDTSDE